MKNILVTGANRGIGLELVAQLAGRGEQVLAACRVTSAELDALAAKGVRVETGVDMTSDASARSLGERLREVDLDWLILNAGTLEVGGLEDLDAESLKRQYDVNAVGPLRVVKALLPNLKKGSKIGLVSSRVGSVADNTSGGMYGYRMSKSAMNMAGKCLALDLAPRGVSVVVLHPGFIRTRMTGGNGNDGPDVAARGLIARMDTLGPATSGRFFHANGEELPW